MTRHPLRPLSRRLTFLIVSAFALPVLADEAPVADDSAFERRLGDLDQQIRVLQRQHEIAQEEAAKKAKEAPVAGFTPKNGFHLQSADGASLLKLKLVLQADGRFFFNDDSKPVANQFLFRRVRPVFEGKLLKNFEFRLMPELAGATPQIIDAYLDLAWYKAARLRVGKFRPPVGYERLQSAASLEFIERGLPTNLVPNRDLGVQLFGEIAEGALEYQVGIFNGVADGASAESDTTDDKEGAARIFALPFKPTELWALQGLGVGVSGSYGYHRGDVKTPAVPAYRSHGQQGAFSYLVGEGDAAAEGTVYANGQRLRLSPHFSYYNGPLGLLGEYVLSTQSLAKGAEEEKLTHNAWQVYASYVLTGEDAGYRGVTPESAVDPETGGWGAWEVAARYGRLELDDKTFPAFADEKKSVRSESSYGGAINWHLEKGVKIAFNYDITSFEKGGGVSDRPTEQALFTRFQLAY